MDKESQIYVCYGDYVLLTVEGLNGNVACQGFSNKNVFLQLNPPALSEVLARNKRDFVWQIMPKVGFDARKDYDDALDFYEK